MAWLGSAGSAGMPFEHLPEGWESTVDSHGRVYYFNRDTQAVRWTRPVVVAPAEPSEDLPDGWEGTVDNLGQVYYYNIYTQEVRWTRPDVEAPAEPSESGVASWRDRANSTVSTEASDCPLRNRGSEPPRSRRRHRRRRDGLLAGPGLCGCNCQADHSRDLGPQHRTLRCRCPFCGHPLASSGHGCHRRVRADSSSGALVVCRDCSSHCLTVLIMAEQHAAGGDPFW